MEKRYDKGQIETVVLQAVLARPYKEFGGCRIYPIHAEGEEAVVKNLAGSREVTTLAELEDAVNAPEVANVFYRPFCCRYVQRDEKRLVPNVAGKRYFLRV